MAFSRSEREKRAAAKVAREEGPVNWLSLGPHLAILRLVKRERQEEEAEAKKKMAKIAALDLANAVKLGFASVDGDYDAFLHSSDRANVRAMLLENSGITTAAARLKLAEQQAAVDLINDETVNVAIDAANRRRQPRKPEGYHHPLAKEVRDDRRLRRQIKKAASVGKSKLPPRSNWKEKIAAGSAWQEALKWFRMTPVEQAAAEAAIETAVNTEIGLAAQVLVAQAEWDELAASGKLDQMDFFGYVWPTDEK